MYLSEVKQWWKRQPFTYTNQEIAGLISSPSDLHVEDDVWMVALKSASSGRKAIKLLYKYSPFTWGVLLIAGSLSWARER